MSKPQKKILLTPEEEHCFSPEELLADNGSLLFGFLSVFEEEPEKFSKEQIAQFLLGFYEMTIPDDPMRVQCHTKIRDITAEVGSHARAFQVSRVFTDRSISTIVCFFICIK
jgi:hypothetical protein